MHPKWLLTILSTLIIIALLGACTAIPSPTPLAETVLPDTPPVGAEASVTPTATEPPGTTPTPSQTFTIVSAYEGMADFIKAAQDDPDADLYSLHRQKAIDPYEAMCRSEKASYYFKVAPFDLDPKVLADEVERLRDSGVEEVVEEALYRASALLPGPDITVCIYPADPASPFTRQRGVGGYAVDSRRIVLIINPVGDWLYLVPFTVAHEYHHAVWMACCFTGWGNSGVFNLVFEGRADSFAHLVYPYATPWTNVLTPEEELIQWQAIQPYLRRTNYNFRRHVMIGDGEDVPLWTGYAIGFHIVQAYLRAHPEVSIEEWTAMDPEVILTESGYDGRP